MSRRPTRQANRRAGGLLVLSATLQSNSWVRTRTTSRYPRSTEHLDRRWLVASPCANVGARLNSSQSAHLTQQFEDAADVKSASCDQPALAAAAPTLTFAAGLAMLAATSSIHRPGGDQHCRPASVGHATVAGIATIAKSVGIQKGEICADPVERTAQILAARNRR
jgi:hypothetical protein